MSIFVASQVGPAFNQAANAAQDEKRSGLGRFFANIGGALGGGVVGSVLKGGAGIPRQLEVLDTPREKETGTAAYAVLGVFSLATLALLFYAIKSK